MRHEAAERKIKALQKQFFTEIENHPVLFQMEPNDFNAMRKRVFRGTFEAYRLGVVGLERGPESLWEFFAWLGDNAAIRALPPEMHLQVNHLCLCVALEAFRIGALVAAERGHATI